MTILIVSNIIIRIHAIARTTGESTTTCSAGSARSPAASSCSTRRLNYIYIYIYIYTHIYYITYITYIYIYILHIYIERERDNNSFVRVRAKYYTPDLTTNSPLENATDILFEMSSNNPLDK